MRCAYTVRKYFTFKNGTTPPRSTEELQPREETYLAFLLLLFRGGDGEWAKKHLIPNMCLSVTSWVRKTLLTGGSGIGCTCFTSQVPDSFAWPPSCVRIWRQRRVKCRLDPRRRTRCFSKPSSALMPAVFGAPSLFFCPLLLTGPPFMLNGK